MSDSREHLQLRYEPLDISRFQDAAGRELLANFLRQKYAGQKIDLAVAALSHVLDFALEYREKIFPGVPIVFAALDDEEVRTRTLPADVIGVPIQMDLVGTLELALRLQPKTRRVFVVVGRSSFDARWEAIARQRFRSYENKLEFVYLSGLTMDDLLIRVANLPSQSIVQYLHMFEDAAGKTFIPAEALKLVASRANVPIYSHIGSYMGLGVVGGHVMSFELAGKNAASLGLRILAGERPETMFRPDVSSNEYVIDWRQLRRWALSEAALPAATDVRYREPSVWDRYRWQIIGAISLFVLQTALLVALVVQRVHRRRADLQFWQVVETAPYGMIMVGQDGVIAMANAQAEKLFGYRREELVGQPVEILVPDRFRPRHAGHRVRFSAAPEVRPMGAGQDLFARRKDGSEFPVEIALSPAQPHAGRFVLATIVDISVRRKAEEELRLSQVELRRLTGRLLQAQEGESRRIARELHDDLGQRLALLTVEMDLLRQKPPEAAGQLSSRIQELLRDIRQLSSSVHELSHQLHPAKLEQLGLAAAIASLCHELTHRHGLKIEFAGNQIPSAVPPETALCLYRIAQEGLANSIKHGGAEHVRVELSGTADLISLQIVDDGIGFDPKVIQGKGGLGLVSMRERVFPLGGEIVIDSQPSGGTRVHVRVPSRAPAPSQ